MSRTRIAGAAALVLASSLLASCTTDGPAADGGPATEAAPEQQHEQQPPPPVKVLSNATGTDVPVDRRVRIGVRNGTLRQVTVTSELGRVPGRMAGDSWRATGRLEPGVEYAVRAVAERTDGRRATRTLRFTTTDLTLDEQTYASVAPLDGETVGVGMPVIVTFDVPVSDRAAMERHMTVTSTPRQLGTWHWVSDTEVHWRPRTYWRAGSHVSVDLDINSVDAGNGIYGQESRHVEFDVGDSVVSRIDVAAHRMRVFVNGDLARTIPISAGKPGWETRSGTKVIIEKFRRKRMNAATIGVDRDDPEYYNLSNVQYALRVTYSGEFLHAAPWSVGSQGSANVSHGCVGMSLEDAAWLYSITSRGDVVEVTGSDRQMTLYNGYGDWNADFASYAEGSALS
jgi:lipoprotein-anchoring transpeptidase ErfK/SrfK